MVSVPQLTHSISLTYEQLTDEQGSSRVRLLDFLSELESINLEVPLYLHSLHGWIEQPLTNLNDSQAFTI